MQTYELWLLCKQMSHQGRIVLCLCASTCLYAACIGKPRRLPCK